MGMASVDNPFKDLPPCPFCGEKWLNVTRVETYQERGKRITTIPFVYCANSNCGAHGPQRDTVDEAIAAWTKRVLPE
jgi:Lar family restriction alleviation protein